jgi:hypothetical protein
MVILAIIQVILDLRGFKPKETSDGTPVDFQFTQGIDPLLGRKRAITMFIWFFGFFLGVRLLGFSITIALMVFTYLRFQGRESWALSSALTVGAWLFFYGLFDRLLHLPFPDGLIQTWLGLT